MRVTGREPPHEGSLATAHNNNNNNNTDNTDHPTDDTHDTLPASVGRPPAPTASLQTLPPELLDLILHHVPPPDRTRAALSLARATGHAPAPAAVWRHVVVRRGAQLMPLWRTLLDDGRRSGRAADTVRTYCHEAWRGDADILNNVLRCLPRLRTILLNMGTNFAPEHLSELFEDPRDVQRVEMRFRPYVEQATYYQFLKGSYFDAAISTLTNTWPETPAFTQLSIVQDVPPRKTAPPTRNGSLLPSLSGSMSDLRMDSSSNSSSVVSSPLATAAAIAAAEEYGSDGSDSDESTTPPTSVDECDDSIESKGYTRQGPFPYLGETLKDCKVTTFAQPIVFFDIGCMARFGVSPVAKHLTHLRLRVPSRELGSVLVSRPGLFPSLRYMDLSTTNVRLDGTLAPILRYYSRLEHLVLDRVNLFGFNAREKGTEMCKDLGGLCVSAGLARGKDRERAIAAWDLAERIRIAEQEAALRRASAGPVDEAARAAADAEAMREEMQRNIALARSRRGHRSAGHSTISLRDRPGRRGAAGAPAAIAPADIPLPDRAYFILPPLPSLKTISIGGEAPLLSSFRVSTWEDEFHAGWREGLAKLSGWATHVAEKYERALKKGDEWKEWDARDKSKTKAADAGGKGHHGHGKGKGKAAAPSVAKPRPPLDIRLFRYPTADEETPVTAAGEPCALAGLIEVHPERARDYLDAYKDAIADADMYTHSQAVRPPCVLCTVPDCEGPRRRGEEGLRIDGRGGMSKMHRDGCGHGVGRDVWGWQGVEDA